MTEAERLLKEAEKVLDECRLINDAVEGWLQTKGKPSEELAP